MKVGFIGLGNMGGSIAHRLQLKGHQLIVHDIDASRAQPYINAGGTWADSPKAVARDADIVLTSLPGPAQVEAVVLGRNGVLEGIADGGLLVDLSTSSPSLALKLSEEFAARHARFLDAPVSGSITQAREGQLTILVGGSPDDLRAAEPLLADFSREILHLGPVAAGLVGKLANNAAVMGTLVLLSEVMSVAVAAGIEPRALLRALQQSSFGRGMVLNFLLPEIVLPQKFTPPTFSLDLGRKDIGLINDLAGSADVSTPLLALVEQSAVEMVASGRGGEDSSVLYSLQERRSGRVIHDSAEAAQ